MRHSSCRFAEPGPRLKKAGPRSAPLREVLRAALRPGHKSLMGLTKFFFAFLIPVPQTSLILLTSCPTKGRFPEAILLWTERKLAGPGRPGMVDGLVAGGALGGAAPSLGRARCLAARGGYVNPASKGAHWCPGASQRSIPSRGSRGIGKPRTHCAARTRGCGCLKFESPISCPGRDAALLQRCFAEPGPPVSSSRK